MTLAAMLVALTATVAVAQDGTPLPKLIMIGNVNVFDSKTGRLHRDMHVLLRDNLIETVSAESLAVVQTDDVTMRDV